MSRNRDITTDELRNAAKNYVKDTLADTGKCREALGFQARISLEEGIRRLVEGEKRH